MKQGIHPQYYDATIKCACGAVLKVGSTQKEMRVEICSQCHPFYTGKKKVVDSAGRVDRFKHLAEKAAAKKAEEEKIKKAKKERMEQKKKEEKKREERRDAKKEK